MYERHLDAEDSELNSASLTQADFENQRLPVRPIRFSNPLQNRSPSNITTGSVKLERAEFLPESAKILANPISHKKDEKIEVLSMRLAGPRESLHFEHSKVIVGIVTCGGLCPGLNDVIRGLTSTALGAYHAQKVIGFRYGFWGLSDKGRHTATELTYDVVGRIHRIGGSYLGTSRGPQDPKEMVDTLVEYGITILFTVGGDGTQKGASGIAAEIARRNLNIGCMGIPKTIDNDISFSHRTFGFETAVEQAVHAIRCAHAEAISHQYGVGLVKVMGRHSGFIAAQSVLASAHVHICLIPECPITEETFFKLLEVRFQKAQYCVIVVAEGFGEDWTKPKPGEQPQRDPSGNIKLVDIGNLLAKKIGDYMKKQPERFTISTVKYIDPSYIIRACPADGSDSAFCIQLAMLAMHEAMSGITNAMVLSWYDHFVVVPIKLATSIRKVVDLHGRLWRAVREVTVDLDEKGVDHQRHVLERQLARVEGERINIERQLSKL